MWAPHWQKVRPFILRRRVLIGSTEQSALLLQIPLLLNALLTISQSRNWLTPTLAIMRLHAFFTQALPPAPAPRHQLAQLPGIKLSEAATNDNNYTAFAHTLEEQADGRVTDVRKALSQWGRVEIVDVSFRGALALSHFALLLIYCTVIGERLITPSSIVYLVVKLRVAPPDAEPSNEQDVDGEEAKGLRRAIEEREDAFLTSRRDAEELQPGQTFSGGAHAPFWPAVRSVLDLIFLPLNLLRRRANPAGGSFSRTTSRTVSWSRRSRLWTCRSGARATPVISVRTRSSSRRPKTPAF